MGAASPGHAPGDRRAAGCQDERLPTAVHPAALGRGPDQQQRHHRAPGWKSRLPGPPAPRPQDAAPGSRAGPRLRTAYSPKAGASLPMPRSVFQNIPRRSSCPRKHASPSHGGSGASPVAHTGVRVTSMTTPPAPPLQSGLLPLNEAQPSAGPSRPPRSPPPVRPCVQTPASPTSPP